MTEEERLGLAMPEIRKLDVLEDDVEEALQTGQINGINLTGAQLVDLMKERRRIVEDRSTLSGAMPCREVVAQ